MGYGDSGTVRSGRGNRGAGRSGQGTRRAGPLAALLALVRAWVAGCVTLALVLYFRDLYLQEPLVDQTELGSLAWRMLVLYLPTAAACALVTLVAARLHPEPFRNSPVQHLLAAMTVPLGAFAVNFTYLWEDAVAEGILFASLAVAVGCFAAVVVDVSIDRRDQGPQ
ncbi:hypothetical protein DSC45_02955 [Streptomyces sp. YIM 130001]|uniref:hypothetical protein n=1 Tax=Streptomyces sp. YIM 130001 TaxID=2259644 RepID=UPI000EE18A5F|nr:hypothetical protein [Streptomyces sp. YIM 130001]RII20781.1 hypothetical protein DSC45_02955 [Streptomyces sp. YIM 130001]